jgi:branched-chain amino acid transport system substrate-binding protein
MSRMARPRRLAVLAGVALIASSLGCGGGADASSDTIRIGLLTDKTGRFVDAASDITAAVELAIEQVNAHGGVDGTPLELVTKDTSGEAARAVVGLRELESDGVVAVLGPISSSEAEAVFALAGDEKIPVVSGTVNKDGITALGNGWAFRNTATNTQLYEASMPIFKERYGVTSAGLIYDSEQAFAKDAADGAIPSVARELGISIDSVQAVTSHQTDFTSVVQHVKETPGLDGLIVATTAPVALGLAGELSRQGVTLPILGHSAQNTGLLQEDSAVHDWVVPSVVNPDSTDARYVDFEDAMKSLDDHPPTLPEAANYYDSVFMLTDVLERAAIGPTAASVEARMALRDGLASLHDFDGLVGSVSFTPAGDVDRPVYTLLLDGANPPTVLR